VNEGSHTAKGQHMSDLYGYGSDMLTITGIQVYG
jgi:hypothetical protein